MKQNIISLVISLNLPQVVLVQEIYHYNVIFLAGFHQMTGLKRQEQKQENQLGLAKAVL